MTLLVFGRTGQVATELARLEPNVICLGRDQADFIDPIACVEHVEQTDARAVIIAVAYTAVDKAESEEALALTINASTPGAIARACALRGLPLVYISTDYVFDGAGTQAFKPDHLTQPLGAYGRTKLRGEKAVRAAGETHVILRTSWVFSAYGSNFLKTMLRLSETRDHLTIVADQVGGPTPAGGIAAACLAIAQTLVTEPGKSGTYHYAGAPDASWADFAREIFAVAGRDVRVEDIPTFDYPTPAARPLNSRLDCSATAAAFGIARPDWRQAVAEIVKELT